MTVEISARLGYYIKLGFGWEGTCIKNGLLRLLYKNVPHEICASGNWADVSSILRETTPDPGAVTRHVSQLRTFYEAPSDAIWTTFHSDRLWWSFADTFVEADKDGGRTRRAIGGWKDEDIKGNALLKGSLSGRLLATEGFRGSICTVSELTYLLHKVNGTIPPEVQAAQSALSDLTAQMIPMIQRLHDKDFETYVDLLFRQGGWVRTGIAGGNVKDIDLDLLSYVSGERIGVQIKSQATKSIYAKYKKLFQDMKGFTRFYFVCHSPDPKFANSEEVRDDELFVYWGPETLAQLAVQLGLVGWLLDKAA